MFEVIGTPSIFKLIRKAARKFVYYESLNRELKTKPIYECRCDERLKLKLMNLHASHTLGSSGNWDT